MLLKWLFTLLAILWLYEAITRISRDQKRRSKAPYRDNSPLDDEEFTDYEELDNKRKR
jgi:hypothetical protein